ncbi:MAG: D-glycero-beta-D-manno-heptose 1-phosphate adenylyltransferase [Candidatus Zixiibacteriota bacterium]|nr:MAG: D-glycero-beta-D-manno-heptose 1-phosphate adenylyltransferase [candidate division Zixibacteria bacterium]
MSLKNLITRADIARVTARLRQGGKKIVFTNGVFDILHRGHVEYLSKAKSFGHVLIVGLNNDASVRRIKGGRHPIQKQKDRAIILLALEAVDYVVFFGEDTPEKLIHQIRPDVLVKGADYKISDIVGSDFVRSYGGKVKRVKLTKGRSTSAIIRKLDTIK